MKVRRSRLAVVATSLMVVLGAGWMWDGALTMAQSIEKTQSGLSAAPLEPSSSGTTGDELFKKLIERNIQRDIRLEKYSATRNYKVTNPVGKIYAEQIVSVTYRAPNHKSFVITKESGSTLIRDNVFKGLIESESETSSGQAHHDSSITPANYRFRLIGEEDIGAYHCFAVEAIPKRNDKYLFEGTIWIDALDYAIVRIAGHPAKSPSFWVNRADFVRQYQKIGEFWLPSKDETVVHVRLVGTKIMTIDHVNYVIN